MSAVAVRLETLPQWTAAEIHNAVNDVATQLGVGLGKVAQPIRVAVSGGSVSPPIDLTLEVLGKEITLGRIRAAVDFARASAPAA